MTIGRIFAVVIVILMKSNLFSSTLVFVIVFVHEKHCVVYN